MKANHLGILSWRLLSGAAWPMAMFAGVLLVLEAPAPAQAQLEITEDFSPFTTGFSINRRFGWWVQDPTTVDDQVINNRNAATSHYDTDRIINNPLLPDNFPVDAVTPIEGDTSYYEVTYAFPFGDKIGGGNVLLELDLPQSDAASNPAGYDATTYDHPTDPTKRRNAVLMIDYKLVMFGPSDKEVPVRAALPGDPSHPTDPMPFAVTDNSDQPVSAAFSTLYLDTNVAGQPCGPGNGTCWTRIGGVGNPGDILSGIDTDDINNNFPDNGGQVFSEAELTRTPLIPDGEVHTLTLPFTFLTPDERAAMGWTGDTRGGGDPLADGYDNPNIFPNFRINTYGGGPRVIVWDNIRIKIVPEPASAAVVLLSVVCLGVAKRSRG